MYKIIITLLLNVFALSVLQQMYVIQEYYSEKVLCLFIVLMCLMIVVIIKQVLVKFITLINSFMCILMCSVWYGCYMEWKAGEYSDIIDFGVFKVRRLFNVEDKLRIVELTLKKEGIFQKDFLTVFDPVHFASLDSYTSMMKYINETVTKFHELHAECSLLSTILNHLHANLGLYVLVSGLLIFFHLAVTSEVVAGLRCEVVEYMKTTIARTMEYNKMIDTMVEGQEATINFIKAVGQKGVRDHVEVLQFVATVSDMMINRLTTVAMKNAVLFCNKQIGLAEMAIETITKYFV